MTPTKTYDSSVQVNWAHFIAGQAGVVPLSIGEPGTGKTATHDALAKLTKRHCQAFLLDQLVPEDIGGYPTVSDVQLHGRHHSVLRRCPDERLFRCLQQPSIILVDEVTNVGRALQAAALQLLNEGLGRFLGSLAGDAELYSSDNTWLFAAANPVENAANGVDLSPPFVNRLCILQWETDRKTILNGWANGFEFAEPNVPVLPDNWKSFLPGYGVLLKSFISDNLSLFERVPKNPDEATKPFPTPRSWTNVGRLLAAAESVDGNAETRKALVCGCVGEPAGAQFFNWLAERNLPDPESLLADPLSLQLPQRGDLAVAILASVLNRVKLDRTPERWEAARKVIEIAGQRSKEAARTAEGPLWLIKPPGYEPIGGDTRVSRKTQVAGV